MKSQRNIHRGFAIAATALLFSACASQPTSKPVASSDTHMQAAKVAPLQISKPVTKTKPQKIEPGSVASLVDKLEHNRRALYWREKNAYAFYIGSNGAEYKPGEGLEVVGTADDKGVECHFSEKGDFQGTPQAKKACQDIMYSLDIELSE